MKRAMKTWAALLFGGALVWASATVASAQTGIWASTDGWYWDLATAWSNNFVPNGVGHWAWLTGNNNLGAGFSGTPIITQNIDVTLGYLILGDVDRGSAVSIRGSNDTTSAWLTFNTGDDGVRALLSHGSGDLHRPGVPGWHYNIGTASDFINVGIRVADPQGLYIDMFQDLRLHGGATNSRALDGGGRDIIKAEAGALYVQRIMTNINNFYVRSGRVIHELEGLWAMRPTITNIIIGVAPGQIDLGEWHPIQHQTNIAEGTSLDRMVVPFWQISGDNRTNELGLFVHDFNVTLNEGSFRTFSRSIDVGYRPNWTNHLAVFSGTWTLSGTASRVWILNETAATAGLTSSVRQQVWAGRLTGPGGFTKVGSGEMLLLNTNDFQGAMLLLRELDHGRSRYGSVALRLGGMLTDAEGVKFQRIGSLYIDNEHVNIGNRLPDDFYVVNNGWGRLEFRANPAGSSETIGAVTNLRGALHIVFDHMNTNLTSAQSTLNLAALVRQPGSIIHFNVRDIRQGALETNAGPAMVTVNLGDGGASLFQVGGGGGVGTVTRSLAVGVFGGDGSDIALYDTLGGIDINATFPTRADQFMTVDGGRLRTLRDDEMVHLGDRATNFLFITQASAPTNANVNLAWRATRVDVNTFVSGTNNMIKNRIVEDVTWNALRFGIATNIGGATLAGNALLLEQGRRLTLESGMFLTGRDTRSERGDDAPGADLWLFGGTLDLDGTQNNREGIIHAAHGNSLYIASVIEARNGLTKGGENSVFLYNANAISGTVNIVRGLIAARHPAALGGATQVVITAGSALWLNFGGSFNAADLDVQPLPYGAAFLVSEGGHNQWNGRTVLRMVDDSGQLGPHEPQIVSGSSHQNASLTVTGDIALDVSGANPDIWLFDPIRLTTGSSAGILNLKGYIGDRFVDGVAQPQDTTGATWDRLGTGNITNRTSHENFALRIRVDGPSLGSFGDELAVNIYRPLRITGRFFAEQGAIRFLGDPAAGEGRFWDDTALARSDFANAMSGFQLAGPGTDSGGSVTFLLTRDGQQFNAERWTVATDITNNTVTMGLEHFGPLSATVTIGNTFNDPTPAGDDNRVTFNRDFRLFAPNGYDSAAGTSSVGRVIVLQTLRGDLRSRLVKVGSGEVWLRGPDHASYGEANDVATFVLHGGELVLDRSPGSSGSLAWRRTRDSGAQLILAGGDVTHYGSANGSFSTELFNGNLVVHAGDSILRARPGGPTQTSTLHVASLPGSSITRHRGGTVHFNYDLRESGTGGAATVLYGTTTGVRLPSWTVFSSNDFQMLTWAEVAGGTNVVPFTGYSIDAYGSASYHTDVRNGFPSLQPNDSVGSLRFNTNLFSNLDLDAKVLNIVDGGILVTRGSSDGFGGPQGIANGTLWSAFGEILIHNYSPFGFNISAWITGPVHLTHSGISTTWLSNVTNAFSGNVFLNGGVLAVSHPQQLGLWTAHGTNVLHLRGGVLKVDETLSFSTNTFNLGGDGGTIWVAAGRTASVFGVIMSETNLLGIAQNNAHGTLIKTGPGALVIGGHSNVFNRLDGLVDIRGGALVIERTAPSNDVIFGQSHSYYDGIIVRSGAQLVLNNRTNVNNVTTDFRDWLILEQGASLIVLDPDAGWQTRRWNAPIWFQGDATVFVDADEIVLGLDAGYLEGPGALIKEGDGRLIVRAFSPDFTGAIRVQDGTFDMQTRHVHPLPNAAEIVIGFAANTNRGFVAVYARPEMDAYASEMIIGQNIRVVGETETTRLGVFRSDHDDVVRFTGNVDLTGFDNFGNLRSFQLYRGDENAAPMNRYENGYTLDERVYTWLEGSLIGTNKRIRTFVEQVFSDGFPNTMNNPTNLQIKSVWTLSGTNTAWTGTLEIGNRQGTAVGSEGQDSDKEHYVRFGRNDGNPTLAISSNVVVVLRHDARLQAFGSQVTIGSLFTDGLVQDMAGGFFGSDPTTNSFIENAGTQPGSFRIVQFTNATISATIRDGTFWGPRVVDQPAAPLSILKDGPATLTLLASNRFSGMARVMNGTLTLSGTGSIRNAHTIQIDAGATLNVTPRIDQTLRLASGQTLRGHGTLQGGLIAEAGSFVRPGSSPGTLTVTGDVTFQNGSTFEVELLGTLAGQWDQLLMTGAYELTLNSATLSVLAPNPLMLGFVFPIIENWNTIDSSTFNGLPDGATFAAGANLFQINYGTLSGYENDVTLTVIPEPNSLGLLSMVVAAVLLRRRLH